MGCVFGCLKGDEDYDAVSQNEVRPEAQALLAWPQSNPVQVVTRLPTNPT
jgi:hypothetical protein